MLQRAHDQQHSLRATNGNNRTQTLDRLDLERSRQRQVNRHSGASLHRNLSSLGHHPPTVSHSKPNSFVPPPPPTKQQQIYAPASIASPREFKRPSVPITYGNNLNESQHYAATSYRGTSEASTTAGSRSGRESALGQLIERFGDTLKRRSARWYSSGRRSLGGKYAKHQSREDKQQPLHQPTALDPEIYATGKREVEPEAIYAEGLSAINGNSQRRLIEHELDESIMSEGEIRTLIEGESQWRPQYQELVCSLVNWINDELAQQRIVVRDLQNDLYDGQILGKLFEKLHNVQLDLIEVTQNEAAQKRKLRHVLDSINRVLALQARWVRIRWSVDGIHAKNMVEIIHLLIALALYYCAPIKLPSNVRVQVLVVQKSQGKLIKRSHEAQLTELQETSSLSSLNPPKRDAFDALFEMAPEKLAIVKQSLVNFTNRHLNKINLSCFANRVNDALDPEQFSDGLLLVFLIATLEDYFVPLGNLFTIAQDDTRGATLLDINNNSNIGQTAIEPTSYTNTQPIHKLHNVNVALQLIEEAGIEIRDKVRAEDIVNGDLKSLLRILYALFSRYKHL